jgi:ElaB/YqjD/DUF883 family membrane-anchored ribosome-binding protein
MSNETDDNSQHAADHIEGVMNEMDAVFNEVKATAAQVRAAMRKEGEQMKGNLQLFDDRVVKRMRNANARFANFIGGNGGPPLDDVKVIEHKSEE